MVEQSRNPLQTSERWGRRHFLRCAAGIAATPVLPSLALGINPVGLAHAETTGNDIERRPIPSSGERISAIGMGTYITFNVGPNQQARRQLTQVLEHFFRLGGGMIDSSPMYGTAEAVLGDLLARVDTRDRLFSATKVWTRSTPKGREQIDNALELWGVDHFDLLQVHNLVNWQAHLETLRQRRDDELLRYIGLTTSHGRRHDELERIMRKEPLDFVQLTYNIVDREVEQRLLPLAADRGIAVVVNRPFRRGGLFDRVTDAPLPDWAADYAIANWAQFFLKFIISHPAVTCTIPATSQPEHMQENMGALRGPLPNASARRAMIDYFDNVSTA